MNSEVVLSRKLILLGQFIKKIEISKLVLYFKATCTVIQLVWKSGRLFLQTIQLLKWLLDGGHGGSDQRAGTGTEPGQEEFVYSAGQAWGRSFTSVTRYIFTKCSNLTEWFNVHSVHYYHSFWYCYQYLYL